MRHFRVAVALLTTCMGLPATSVLAQLSIPESLEPWRDWVLYGQEYRDCPILNGASTNATASYICAWPGELDLAVTADGASFEQQWTVYKDEWLPLPGDARYWPDPVSVDGVAQAAVLRDGRPTVRVPRGTHSIAGNLGWQNRPASIPVPTQTGLIELTLDGTAVPVAEIDGGTLWLGLRPELAVEEDRLDVAVYRRLTDAIPLRLQTRVQLDVAGQARELELSGARLPGFVGESLDSELPAELDADGTLRLQVRPGRWAVTLVAHRADIAAPLTREAAVGAWPDEEVWSFESNPTLRVSVLEGAPAVDAARAGVPNDWRNFPSFTVAADRTLNLVERSRNDAEDDNELALDRLLWLDFDAGGYTAHDRVTGQLNRGWRLDMVTPFTMTMASIGGENLLVTDGQEPGMQGVELRTRALDLSTTARLPPLATLPVTGYADTFNAARTLLFLPPAYRLVAAPGVDTAADAWIERWRLLDTFLMLIIAVATWRLVGPVGGVVALATMALIFHEPWAPHYAWLNVLLIMALLRVVPEGRIAAWCRRYRFVSLVALGLLLIPFVATELRVVVFPQLEQPFLARNVARGLPLAAPGATPAAQVTITGSRVRRDDLAAPNAMNALTPEQLRSLRSSNAPVQIEDSSTSNVSEGGLTRYQAGALVQTGPGLPDWAWSRYALGFDGPIDPEQTFTLVIFGPWLVGLWRVTGVTLALLFAWLLVKPDMRWPGWGRRRVAHGAVAAAVIAAALAIPDAARAQRDDGFPSPQLLNELRQRLIEPAPCHPACAELAAANVAVTDTGLSMELQIAVQDSVAVPIPGDVSGWRPQTIAVDGADLRTMLRDGNGVAWIRLEDGVRNVRLAGAIPAGESLRVPFPLPPRRIAVAATGWDVAGVNEGRLPSGTLELTRQRAPEDGEDNAIQATAFPPYVDVIRTIELGLDWNVSTTVRRIAPNDGAFTIGIALLANESVVTEDVAVDDGSAQIAFATGQNAAVWQSRLPSSNELTITAADDVPWSETWRLVVGHEWHAEHAGVPLTRAERTGPFALVTEYLPRPGETLTLDLSRPEPVSGDTIAIDNVDYARTAGERSSSSSLSFVYRSTRAVEHPIRLPPESQLESVEIDGRSVPLELDADTLTLPVTPGQHQIDVAWRNLTGVALRTSVARVDLGAGTSNLTTRLSLPANRWILLTFGPTLGPAVLYWAELVVFVLAAFIAGRLTLSPLRTHEWLLLGLGLSTFSWPVLLLFAGWAFLMSVRGRQTIGHSRWRFNGVQIVLGVLTLVTLVSLIGSIANGLLGAPNMHIVSPVRDGSGLSWFTDRADGQTPATGAISVSLWFYKAAMLAWALWLSFALLRWLGWAWSAFSFEGIWRGKPA